MSEKEKEKEKSLFDFIKDEMTPEDRAELFMDKTVCLCLFRVCLTPLE